MKLFGYKILMLAILASCFSKFSFASDRAQRVSPRLKLFRGITSGDKVKVQEAIAEGADLNKFFDNNLSPLGQATSLKNSELVEVLLESKANIDEKGSFLKCTHLATVTNDATTLELLLRKKANPISLSYGYKGKTPLLVAAENNSAECAELLIRYGADPNYSHSRKFSNPLITAQTCHNGRVLQVLSRLSHVFPNMKKMFLAVLEKKNFARAQEILEYWQPALSTLISDLVQKAYHNGEVEVFEFLLPLVDINAWSQKNKQTLLHLAVDNGDEKLLIRLLRDFSANPNKASRVKKEKEAIYPLYWACHKKQAAIAEILLSYGAEVNLQNALGYTALHEASYQVDLNCVNILLADKNRDLNLLDKHGNTALHWLALAKVKEDKAAIGAELLAAGIDIDLKNNKRKTALCTAAELSSAEFFTFLFNYKQENHKPGTVAELGDYLESAFVHEASEDKELMIEFLLEAGAYSFNSLLKSVQDNHKQRVKILLENGKTLKQEINTGALVHEAAATSKAEILAILLEHDIEALNALNAKEQTPLHIAAEKNQIDCVKLLVRHLPNTKLKDKSKRTAADYAYRNSNGDMLQLIKKVNANRHFKIVPL